MPEEFRIVVGFATCERALDRADAVLSLIDSHPDLEATLSAAGALAAASALAQGIQTVLQTKAQIIAAEEGIPIGQAKAKELASHSFREQMLELPRIVSENSYALNRKSPVVEVLHRLIHLRNELMHVEESPRILSSSSPEVLVKDSMATVQLPFPDTPWDSVSRTAAEGYVTAVREYLRVALSIPLSSTPSGETAFATTDLLIKIND
jgi:hypothetical protein